MDVDIPQPSTSSTNTAGTSPSITPVPPVTALPASTPGPSHRLLYRGALSLPDSLLLLDGISFTLPLSSSSSSLSTSPLSTQELNAPTDAVSELLNNSLALALESMRGRPSLHLVGVEEDVEKLVLESGVVCV